MAETISAVEARNKLGELMNRAGYGGERFVLSHRGRPLAALIGDIRGIRAI